MLNIIRKITILFSIIFILFLGYEAFMHNSARSWKNYKEPKLASFTSLAKDEIILKELKSQTLFKTYKPLDASIFVKSDIFRKN